LTRITQTDQILLLLQATLAKAQKTARSARPGDTAALRQTEVSGLNRLRALAGVESLSDDDIEQALVSAILADAFGPGAANDAGFQQTVRDVTALIRQHPKASALLNQAMNEVSDRDGSVDT
jgi:hypothetical protein